MLSTTFKGIQVPKYTDNEIKDKLSIQDFKDYVSHLDKIHNHLNNGE